MKTEGGGAAQAARSKKPSSRNRAGAKLEDKHVSKPVRVRNFKGHTKKQLSESFSKIVEAHLEEAKNGSLKHTDWLFEVGGVKQEIRAEKKGKGRDPSLASLLLLELEKQQSKGGEDGLMESPEKADPLLSTRPRKTARREPSFAQDDK